MNPQLIHIVEAINTARLAANSNDSTASEGLGGVYGYLKQALIITLVIITGSTIEAGHAYDRILNGDPVSEVLKGYTP